MSEKVLTLLRQLSLKRAERDHLNFSWTLLQAHISFIVALYRFNADILIQGIHRIVCEHLLPSTTDPPVADAPEREDMVTTDIPVTSATVPNATATRQVPRRPRPRRQRTRARSPPSIQESTSDAYLPPSFTSRSLLPILVSPPVPFQLLQRGSSSSVG